MFGIALIIFVFGICALARHSKNRSAKKSAYNPAYERKDYVLELDDESAEMTERELKAELKALELQEKREMEIAQAKEDYAYIKQQLNRYYSLIEEANINLNKAQTEVDHDSKVNHYGGVVSEKEVKKHITERDRLVTKVIRLENQIHAAEKKLAKARYILGYDSAYGIDAD